MALLGVRVVGAADAGERRPHGAEVDAAHRADGDAPAVGGDPHVQIALHALQMQDAAVARAAQRLDSARDRRSGAEAHRDRTASAIQGLEDKLASGTPPQAEAKELQGALSEMKNQLGPQTAEVQTRQAAEAEASSQLRSEQAKLADVQDRIDRLDKTLEKLGATGK